MAMEKMDVEAIPSLNMIVMRMNGVEGKLGAMAVVTNLIRVMQILFWVISELMAREVNRLQEVC